MNAVEVLASVVVGGVSSADWEPVAPAADKEDPRLQPSCCNQTQPKPVGWVWLDAHHPLFSNLWGNVEVTGGGGDGLHSAGVVCEEGNMVIIIHCYE